MQQIGIQTKNYVVPKYIMHCDVISMIYAYCLKRNFSRKKQDILSIFIKEVTNPYTASLH